MQIAAMPQKVHCSHSIAPHTDYSGCIALPGARAKGHRRPPSLTAKAEQPDRLIPLASAQPSGRSRLTRLGQGSAVRPADRR
jgi:hypothetical protein